MMDVVAPIVTGFVFLLGRIEPFPDPVSISA